MSCTDSETSIDSTGAIRIVHVVGALPAIGGAERLILDLARHAREQPVPVITWWGTDNSLVDLYPPTAIELIALRPFRLVALKRAIGALRNADVVHFHLFHSQYLSVFICRPSVFTEHGTWNRRRQYPWMRPIERWCYRKFDRVVGVSDGVARALMNWLADNLPNIVTITNGIDLSRFPLVPKSAPATQEVTIGMAARMTAERDHATLIRAMTLLPPSYRLIFAGEGPLKQELRQLSIELGVARRIEFLGTVTDMPKYFSSLHVYVQSSLVDGFSLALVEAMASGLPVFATDIEGLRDTMPSVDTLFTPGDWVSLAARLQAVAADPQQYSSMAQASAAQARAFDIRVTAEKYHRLYTEVLSSAKAAEPLNGDKQKALAVAKKNQKKGSQYSVTTK